MCGILTLGVGVGLIGSVAQENPTALRSPLKEGNQSNKKSFVTQINLEKPLSLREFENYAKENNLPTNELTLGAEFELGEYLVPTQLEYKTVEAITVSPNNPQAQLDPLKSGIAQNYKTQLETLKKEIKNLKEILKNRPVEATTVLPIYTKEEVESLKKQFPEMDPAKIEDLLIPKPELPKNTDIQLEQVAMETTAELDTNQELKISSISFVAKDEVVADDLAKKLQVKKNDKKDKVKPTIVKKDKKQKFNAISTEDISDMFAVDPKAEAKVKEDAKKSLANFKELSKTHKQYLNEQEASGYGKDLPENVEIIGKTKKVSLLDNILDFGTVNASAKGLNNAKFSLIMYFAGSENLALQTMGYDVQARLMPKTGNYGQQRWCFDNDTNQIWSTPFQTCDSKNGMWCLDIAGSYSNGTRITTHPCHSGDNQKWIFTEDGALASKFAPNMCLDSAQGINANSVIQLWSCHHYTSGWFPHQNLRAGYNNFGQNMGMSIWVTPIGYTGQNVTNGHVYMELWNGVGIHNTFGKWPSGNKDLDTCYNIEETIIGPDIHPLNQIKFTTVNNICDNDDIHVDNRWERTHYKNSIMQEGNLITDYYKARANSSLSKEKWDYIAFGSGYRSNYYKNKGKIDLAAYGTYDSNGKSRSRSIEFKSTYTTFQYQCTSYALNFWRAYRENGSTSNLDNPLVFSPNWVWNIIQ